MIIPHFKALKAKLESELNIKKVDWFNDNYNRYTEMKAVGFPNLLIEFPDVIDNWEEKGNGIQEADIEIGIHAVVFDVQDNPESVYTLGVEVFKALNRRFLFDVNDSSCQLSYELIRSQSEKITPDTQVKVFIQYFQTRIMDYSGMSSTTEVSPTLVIN